MLPITSICGGADRQADGATGVAGDTKSRDVSGLTDRAFFACADRHPGEASNILHSLRPGEDFLRGSVSPIRNQRGNVDLLSDPARLGKSQGPAGLPSGPTVVYYGCTTSADCHTMN